MHTTSRLFLEYLRNKYTNYFTETTVIEFGSMNINGSARNYFKRCDYTGIDWLSGPGVDVISLAHEFSTDKRYMTVISVSMLEHDPYWDLSLTKMIEMMKDDGILILGWGGEKNTPHFFKSAPDGGFHPLKGEFVFNFLKNQNIYIAEFGLENSFLRSNKFQLKEENLGWKDIMISNQSLGLVGFKDKQYAIDSVIFEDEGVKL